MLYTVKIIETLSEDITIEAENETDALYEVETQYYKGQIILYPGNYDTTTFEITEVKNDN